MNNTTLPLESDVSLNSPGFMAYVILLTVITLIAGVMIGITLVALAMSRSIPRPLRLFLINLLLAGLLVVVSLMFGLCTSAFLVTYNSEQPRLPLYLCRVYLWLFGVGSVARLWNLAAFSLSVLAVVRFGKKTISLRYATLIITILWVGPMAINLYILLPYLFEAQFIDGVSCYPDNKNNIITQAHFTFFANWAISGGIIPLTVSIAVPIVCLCYIKKHIVTEEATYRKGMAKFSLFLVLGGVISMAGGIIPGAVAITSEAPAVGLGYGIATVSIIPTTVIIIAYLKPVQEQMKKLFRLATCGRLAKATKELKSTTSDVNTNETTDGL